jgi:nucleotide-binding universal stress UspA family protein
MSVEERIANDAKIEFDKLIERNKENVEGLDIDIRILKGDADRTIPDYAGRHDFDMIIMGTKGASNVRSVFMGSVASNVIERSITPVFLIPESYELKKVENVLFGMADFVCEPEVVNALYAFIDAFDPEIELIHFGNEDVPENVNEILDSVFPVGRWKLTIKDHEKDIDKEIEEYAEEVDANLICLVRKKKGFWVNLFGKSVTRSSSYNTKTPMLIMME